MDCSILGSKVTLRLFRDKYARRLVHVYHTVKACKHASTVRTDDDRGNPRHLDTDVTGGLKDSWKIDSVPDIDMKDIYY